MGFFSNYQKRFGTGIRKEELAYLDSRAEPAQRAHQEGQEFEAVVSDWMRLNRAELVDVQALHGEHAQILR